MTKVTKNKLDAIAIILTNREYSPVQMYNRIKKVLMSSSNDREYLFKLGE